MRYNKGFTLVELMITIAILAILISMAAPSFSGAVQSTRITGLSHSLQGSLQLARSEAIKRQAQVIVCRANVALDGCADGEDWSNGWMVLSANETILKLWEGGGGVAVNGPSEAINFYGDGMASGRAQWSINYSACTNTLGRIITLNLIGNFSTEPGGC